MNMTLRQASDLWQFDAKLPPDSRLYALVDCSAAPTLMRELRQRRSLPWQSLFEGTREAGAEAVAPTLIDLGLPHPEPDPAAHGLLHWLLFSCRTNSAWLTIRSRWALQPLATALQRRLDVMLPQNMPVLLRYFDTRVFGSLFEVLDESQRAQFLGVADQWLWLDRAGQLCQQPAQHHPSDPMRETLSFSTAQEAALIDAAEPDAVVHHLRQTAPDLCQRHSTAALHALASTCLRVAHAKGIEDIPQIGLFCMVEMERGPKFYEQPGWREGLDQMAGSDRDFARLVREMEAPR